MTTKRIKRNVQPALTSRAEFETLIGDLAQDIIVERAQRVAMDDELNSIRIRYSADLADIGEEIADKLALAQEYCDAHAELFPRDRKSIELTHAVVGYRTGMPSLKTLRGWTWAKVLDAMRDVAPLAKFIRVKEEPDKAAMLARAAELVDALPLAGMQVVQDETFFVEPKLEELQSRLSETRAA